ncbi:MAG TPA: sigma 54-interacting transcriptional regulator [Gemmataceae bacterium]|nr:sigma 54-interacting transcriptional regulator [Gemmataceae bacterium]
MFSLRNTYTRQYVLFAIGAGVLVYAIAVLADVSSSHDIGIRSIFTPRVIGVPVGVRQGYPTPASGDLITVAGPKTVRVWSDLLQAPDDASQEMDPLATQPDWLWIDPNTGAHYIRILYENVQGNTETTWLELRRFPLEEMIPSLIWLLLKGALFAIGVVVYWKRPNDEAAMRFYILCVITLGAYIGGYHWTQIVTEPVLSITFTICAVLLPVASLHFYLVFPRKKPWLERYPRTTLGILYGVPLANLACLIGFGEVYVRLIAEPDAPARDYLRPLIFVSFGIAAVWYVASSASLMHSVFTVEDPMERKQVRCISIGIFLSLFPIGHSLYIVLAEYARFAEGAVTWPMFGASLIVTVAFAIGMTRYRLMELDQIISSSVGYFLVTFLAGLMYYGVVFIGTLFYNRFVSSPTLPAALTVSTTALLFVLVLDAARSRLQKALDRRLTRSKSQLDETLQQMSQAVAQLIDPHALAQRLLSAASDTLGAAQGAIYLRRAQPPGFALAAHLGAAPQTQAIALNDPLIVALQGGLGLECPASAEGAGSPAQQQLRQLGGEVAQPLLADGKVLAVLTLGSKDTPYRPDDWNLLSAFAQITSVALESAAQHVAIEQLNQELQAKVDKIAEQQRRILALQSQLYRQTAIENAEKEPANEEKRASLPAPLPNVAGIVGSSPVVLQLLSVVRKVAATDAVVLLRGESGTGKELLARAVHDVSPRAAKPYVKVHCAALSANLLESELFGHVKGAFTGAHRDKIGRFELANGGTLFLDEIGDVSLEVQTKLLRVLQEKTIERVGSSESLKVDVRIIAATHQNLEELIRQGRFREDLFYRLNVFPIGVPPLRERREDIPELAVYFVQQSAQRCKKSVMHIDDDALAMLKAQSWPGNIRQLENAIERGVVVAETETLTLQDLPADLSSANGDEPATSNGALPSANEEAMVPTSNFRNERDRFEREQLLRALTTAAGNKAEAARILGIARSTLVSRMKKLGLD